MIFEHVNALTPDGTFREARVETWKNRIVAVEYLQDGAKDGADYLLPGLIDLHLHGAMGADASDGDGIRKIREYEAGQGVTSILLATMTISEPDLLKALSAIHAEMRQTVPTMADVLGVNLEGPFISPEKKGAQDADYIRAADKALFKKYQKAAGGAIQIVGVAPEIRLNKKLIKWLDKQAIVSMAHTNATKAVAEEAIAEGASHATHLYNAMRKWNDSDPGVAGAILEHPETTAELIGDGIHVPAEQVTDLFRHMAGRICLISDSIRATGMPDGTYMLGGHPVMKHGNKAVLEGTGCLAGSVTNLADVVRAVVHMGVPLEQAATAATMVPAARLGLSDRGYLLAGKKADLVRWAPDLTLKAVMKDGIFIKEL